VLNQLLKFTLVSSALLWLRPRWRGLLALSVFVILVHVLHGEYLGYVELSGNADFLVWSYAVKWLALLAGVTAYFFLAVLGPPRRGNKKEPPPVSTGQQSPLPSDDGFDFLRSKKELESRADKVIGKGPGN